MLHLKLYLIFFFTFKTITINNMIGASKAMVQLGNDLNREANGYTQNAIGAFGRLDSQSQIIEDNLEILRNKVDNDRSGIAQNLQRIQEASDHANELEQQAMGNVTRLSTIVEILKILIQNFY